MNDSLYALTQQILAELVGRVIALDLEAFIRRIDDAETVGPIVDPTLYARAGGRLAEVRRDAEAALEFQRRVRESHRDVASVYGTGDDGDPRD